MLALTASSAASYWLALHPPFQIDSQEVTARLEAMGERVFDALRKTPESSWEDKLDTIEGVDDYYIEWFDSDDYDGAVEQQAALYAGNHVLQYLTDGTPLLEVLIGKEALVVELVPVRGYNKRFWLNGAATVLVVLIIGLLAALLTLAPTMSRLNRLRTLAQRYRDGFFTDRNTDQSADAIGELGDSIESMADRVDGLVSDNEQLVEDQRQLMRAVAHEFRAPMARMRFAQEMQNRELSDEDHVVSEALDELDHLVTEVLRYARLQHASADLQLSSVLLLDSMKQAVGDVQVLRPEVKVQIETNGAYPAEKIELQVDAPQWQRALNNLISNALKYTDTSVTLRYERKQDLLLLHVDDDGPGVSQDDSAKIFEPFVRLDSSRTRTRGGSGLGLAIVKGVVLKHGGSLSVTRSPEGGARFSVAIPGIVHTRRNKGVFRRNPVRSQ
jgi:signal transduction histidine kinase